MVATKYLPKYRKTKTLGKTLVGSHSRLPMCCLYMWTILGHHYQVIHFQAPDFSNNKLDFALVVSCTHHLFPLYCDP